MEAFSRERIDRLCDRCMVFVVLEASTLAQGCRPVIALGRRERALSRFGPTLWQWRIDAHSCSISSSLTLNYTPLKYHGPQYRTPAFASSDSVLHDIGKLTIFRLHGDDLSSLGTTLGISKRSMSVENKCSE
jgi:hypothetical protein